MEELRGLLSAAVLEDGVADMIISDLTDMEELRMGDIHIRKIQPQIFKIYKLNTTIELFVRPRWLDYSMDRIKGSEDNFNRFVRMFLSIMKTERQTTDPFVQEILIRMILYSFNKNKNSIARYIPMSDIEQYIQLGINDGIEDIILRAQDEPRIFEMYRPYQFNFTPWSVLVEEDDLVELAYPDAQWIEENNILAGADLNEDGLLVCVASEEIERFKGYLDGTGDLVKIERIAIQFYLEHLIYPYAMDYDNLIHFIMTGVEVEEAEDNLDALD